MDRTVALDVVGRTRSLLGGPHTPRLNALPGAGYRSAPSPRR